MAHTIGALLGIGVGYVVAIGIAAFVTAEDVQSASLLLTLACCGAFGIIGLFFGPSLFRRRRYAKPTNTH